MQNEISHMHKDLSRKKQLLKTPYYLYCINQRTKMKYICLLKLEHNLQVYSLSFCLTHWLWPTHSQFSSPPSSYFFALFLWEIGPYYLGIPHYWIAQFLLVLPLTTCTTYTRWNLEYATTDSTLPWNLHLNWVTQILCIQQLFWSDWSVNWLITECGWSSTSTTWPPLVLLTVKTSLTDNSSN